MYQAYPDEGLISMLKLIAENNGNGLTWALYTNDLEVDSDSLLADFDLANPSWGQVTLLSIDFILTQVISHIGTIQANAIVYTNADVSSVSVYGYVVFDPFANKLIAGARFNSAPRVLLPGGSTSVQAILGDYSESFVPIIDGGEF